MAATTTSARRKVLQGLGATALISSVAACTPIIGTSKYPRAYSRRPWLAPRISRDAVIREVVGHRPYRPAGFVVRREELGDKSLVHNYGHGGGGISLSWGSSALALREIAGVSPGRVAVIGSGVMGLTSARLLQDAGWKVTIYTKDMARHTTSNIAAGEWSPFSVYEPHAVTPAFLSRFEWAARISHHAFTNLGGQDYGVQWLEVYQLSELPFPTNPHAEMLGDLFPYSAVLGRGDHPFPVAHVRRIVTMRIEPAILLRRLTHDFQAAGGRFVRRVFADRDDVVSLAEPVIFNCTGMGAAQLFDDRDLIPAKGQLVFLPPDPAIDYLTIGGGKGLLYMFSRSDALVLGGSFIPGDYTTHADPAQTTRIIEGNQRIFDRFG